MAQLAKWRDSGAIHSQIRAATCPLLPLRSALCLRGGLYGAPPGLVGAVPLDGGGEAGGEVGAGRAPAQLAAQLGAVDDIAAVVSGTVAHPVEAIT